MTQSEFLNAELHNRIIQFNLNVKSLSGIVVNDIFHKTGKTKQTHYTFIPIENVSEWKDAQKMNNKELMYSLSTVIDIKEISWGKIIC
jgi:hypothetical protein